MWGEQRIEGDTPIAQKPIQRLDLGFIRACRREPHVRLLLQHGENPIPARIKSVVTEIAVLHFRDQG
jgi:hypothetical protein